MTIEDGWGGDAITAAIDRLAHSTSTPTEVLFTSTDFNSDVTVGTAKDAPRRFHGRTAAPTSPGPGVPPRMEALGERFIVAESPNPLRNSSQPFSTHGSSRPSREAPTAAA
jgi:hypothetical protein